MPIRIAVELLGMLGGEAPTAPWTYRPSSSATCRAAPLTASSTPIWPVIVPWTASPIRRIASSAFGPLTSGRAPWWMALTAS